MFADDCIFFYRTTKQTARNVKYIHSGSLLQRFRSANQLSQVQIPIFQRHQQDSEKEKYVNPLSSHTNTIIYTRDA